MFLDAVLSRDSVTVDGVWIRNRIYWTITERNYKNQDNLTQIHTPKLTVTTTLTKSSQSSQAVTW
jgi:hypothetical protein